jgi:hypothetical protein
LQRKSDGEDANPDASKKLKTASEGENGTTHIGDGLVEKASSDIGVKSGAETVKQINGGSADSAVVKSTGVGVRLHL